MTFDQYDDLCVKAVACNPDARLIIESHREGNVEFRWMWAIGDTILNYVFSVELVKDQDLMVINHAFDHVQLKMEAAYLSI